MAKLDFDATQVAPQQELKPIPEGEYKAAIVKSENKATKAGTGSFLSLELDILEGEYKGRKLWANLNLNNPNSQAVEIAKSELSAICHAVGVLRPRDSAELHNRPMVISVKLEKRRDSGELQNRIKGYKSLGDAKAQPVAAAATAENGSRPW